MREIDVRHLACPGPVIEVRKLLEEGARELAVHVADELARSNVTRFAASRGAAVTSEPHPDGGFLVRISAGEGSDRPPAGGDQGLECALPGAPSPTPGRPLVVQVSSDRMGSGDDDLGRLLLRSFLKTQLELGERPDTLVFYNAGVKLCCAESILLQDLRRLEAEGVEILACGTCLNFFGLQEQLAVGRVTDMLEIATRLAGAARVVRP